MNDMTKYNESFLSSQNKFNELLSQNMIKEYSICDTKYSLPHGGVIVDLPNGEKGIAVSIIQPHYFVEDSVKKDGNARKIRILKLDGTEYMDLSEPELGEVPSSHAKITKDDQFLYVATYNTKKSYLAKYKMVTFEREWKKELGFTAIQSITVDQDSIICFNLTNGSIDYFNKDSGEKTKSIDVREKGGGHLHHNVAANGLMLLAAVPGTDWILNLPNQLKAFDEQGTMASKKDIPLSLGTLNAVSVDTNSQLVYLAFDNKVVVFGPQGYIGTTIIPSGTILELNVDKGSSSLIVSSENIEMHTGGKIDILSPEAIKALTRFSNTTIAGELEEPKQGHLL